MLPSERKYVRNSRKRKAKIPELFLRFVREQFVQCSPVAYELQITLQYLENAKEKIRLLESENIKLKEELETYKSKLYSKQISTADK